MRVISAFFTCSKLLENVDLYVYLFVCLFVCPHQISTTHLQRFLIYHHQIDSTIKVSYCLNTGTLFYLLRCVILQTCFSASLYCAFVEVTLEFRASGMLVDLIL